MIHNGHDIEKIGWTNTRTMWGALEQIFKCKICGKLFYKTPTCVDDWTEFLSTDYDAEKDKIICQATYTEKEMLQDLAKGTLRDMETMLEMADGKPKERAELPSGWQKKNKDE